MNAALGLLLALPAVAGPEGEWQTLLGRHVADGKVDYAGLARDRAALDRHLQWVRVAARTDLAFYLNAYNATVVRSVLAHGKPARVLDVKGFFDAEKHRIGGRDLTLNELESMVRKRFADPRIHFALNCAARSCPPLHARAFSPATVDRTLDELTRRFLDGDGVRVNNGAVAVSRLFEWYRAEFVAKEGSIEQYLLRWVAEPARKKALEAKAKLTFLDYDWSLNSREPTARR